MGKKDKKVLDKQREGFEAGMKAKGFSAKAVDVLWETLMPFADYAFNRRTAPDTACSATGPRT